MVNRFGIYLILTFVVMAGLSWWLKRDQSVGTKPGESHSPDYYSENMTTIEMGEDGLPQRRLIADKMLHYADDDSTDLIKPHMVLFEEGSPPWTLRSETGWVSADSRDIWLRGQVYIDREGDGITTPYHMVTSELHVTREPDYAETSQPVYVVSDRERVDSIGMQAWLKPKVRVKLLSQVRGRYEQE